MNMSASPLVSIITPCYNSENYITRFMDCLLAQTYSNIEWIAVNDGSIDGTEDLIHGYKDLFDNKGIKVVYHYQENKGIGGAINAGLKYISGEFFTWCDSDNLLTEDYTSKNVEYFLSHPEANIVRCDGFYVLDSDIIHPLSRLSDGVQEKDKKDLFINCLTCKDFYFGCTMLRTEAFDKVNPEREIYPSREGQNWQIMLPMFYHYDSFYMDIPMFYFVIREDSISHAASKKGLKASMDQNNACEETEDIVIRSMIIPEEKEYLEIIHKQYSIIRFWLYDKYDNDEGLEKEYKLIKGNNWMDDSIETVYRRRNNVFWKMMHSLKKWVKKNG